MEQPEFRKPHIETIKKSKPVIAVIVITLTLLAIYLPQCNRRQGQIKASGTIEMKEIELMSRVSSRIVRIDKPEGSTVPKGDVVMTLDDRLVNAQRASAEALYLNALDSFRRSESLYASGIIPKQQYEQARTTFNKAQADFEQAQLMAEETRVTAPWEGTVLRIHAEEGELVAALTPLATFADMKQARIRIYLSAAELGYVKQGQEANIIIDAYPKRKFPGTISKISSKAEFTPKTIQTRDERVKQVFAIEVIADNPDGILKPGMPADVEIPALGKGKR
jgi:HlyD family secretion protein